MSGGSYDYFYMQIEERATTIREEGGCSSDTPGRGCASPTLRRAFRDHLLKCAAAWRAIEWNDSCDGDDKEEGLIKAVVGPQDVLSAAISQAKHARQGLNEALTLAEEW